ncbi:asparagine synthase (glutamine-hydrolyzing) [Amycolatopsis sp. NPDC006131]|uniref:asparagine synthase (glutamine-hydrolyzing) n=1 Tax=Amycolatopsis sp. NPDC006131 TaxID=3156731 RepID=UPI0033BDE4A2
MCGIAGWVSYERDLTEERDAVAAMTSTMSCRGPDASGTWIRREVAFGHRRLAVIDLPGGAQPMTVETGAGTVSLVYSGEVYNFRELRSLLASLGHRFSTSSDTEVVLHAYLEWGEAVAERLNGMFAFAIWDERNSVLFLVRDRMGVKPLYYSPTRCGVLFGSEPKAILANPLVPPVVDGDGIRALFSSFVKMPGSSFWQNVFEVEPGTVLRADRTGLRTRRFWRLESRPHVDDEPTTLKVVRELLDDIVERQRFADVPHCVLLSGGLDSTAITSIAAGQSRGEGRELRTYSVDFVGHSENFRQALMQVDRDAPYVRDVVDLVRSDHEDIVIDARELADPAIRRAVLAARDTPGLGEMDASLYLLCRAIRRQSTVALSGESADEIFGGYPFFHQEDLSETFLDPRRFANFSVASCRAPWLRPELLQSLAVLDHLADAYSSVASTVQHLPNDSREDARARVITTVLINGFLRTLLERKDRISMAVGLEVRVPYCDHRLVEYAYNIPWRMKTHDGREKSVLRNAVRDLLPQSVADRQKSGFPASNDPVYLAALQCQAKDVLSKDDHPVFELMDERWLADLVQLDPTQAPYRAIPDLNNALDFYHWFEIYKPTVILD